jgi:hypothetical protein
VVPHDASPHDDESLIAGLNACTVLSTLLHNTYMPTQPDATSPNLSNMPLSSISPGVAIAADPVAPAHVAAQHYTHDTVAPTHVDHFPRDFW